MYCKYCNKALIEIGNSSNRGNHVRWCENNPSRKQPNIKTCTQCGNEFVGRNRYCSLACSKVTSSSPSTRQKISASRKLYLKNNPNDHPWKKSSKFISKPCETLKEYLKSKGVLFVEEWNPIDGRSFAIDIAFPDIKLGIEVNGNQHYTSDGKLTEYYQNRHELIESYGWKLIELHYSSVYNTDLIDSIINIPDQPDYAEYFKVKESKKKNKAITLQKGQTLKLKSDGKWEPYKELVINSNIDFSKFGWVKDVAKILIIKDQKVCNWMKRYLPEFYDQNCFKRKSATVSHPPSKRPLTE